MHTKHPGMTHEKKHDSQMKQLDRLDHTTKRGGGVSTHGVNFKNPEVGEVAKSPTHNAEKEPIGPKSASNYGAVKGKPALGSGQVKP